MYQYTCPYIGTGCLKKEMVIIMGLSKIEIITGMQKFNGLKRVLSQAGVGGMTFTQVLGCGGEKGTREYEVDDRYEM